MKIAVTAKGKELDSELDPRFGRAQYVLIIDSAGGVVEEVIDNATNRNAFQGAGIQAAKMLADRGVELLLTGFCGPNAFKTLEAAGIRVAAEQSGSVRDAVTRFEKNELRFAESPNAEAHW